MEGSGEIGIPRETMIHDTVQQLRRETADTTTQAIRREMWSPIERSAVFTAWNAAKPDEQISLEDVGVTPHNAERMQYTLDRNNPQNGYVQFAHEWQTLLRDFSSPSREEIVAMLNTPDSSKPPPGAGYTVSHLIRATLEPLIAKALNTPEVGIIFLEGVGDATEQFQSQHRKEMGGEKRKTEAEAELQIIDRRSQRTQQFASKAEREAYELGQQITKVIAAGAAPPPATLSFNPADDVRNYYSRIIHREVPQQTRTKYYSEWTKE
jgi:hypothetical protein